MKNKLRRITKSKAKQLRTKYENGTLSKAERDAWWPYRLKQMRDEYYTKNKKLRN
jgi:hypothetical protein